MPLRPATAGRSAYAALQPVVPWDGPTAQRTAIVPIAGTPAFTESQQRPVEAIGWTRNWAWLRRPAVLRGAGKAEFEPAAVDATEVGGRIR